MSYFAELVKELDRLQRNAASLLGGLGDQGGLGMRRGPTPAVAECVLGLRDLWRIHRDELFAKRALVDELTCDAAMPDLEDVKALFAAEANLDPDAVTTTRGLHPRRHPGPTVQTTSVTTLTHSTRTTRGACDPFSFSR
jgi:hypothetical protein